MDIATATKAAGAASSIIGDIANIGAAKKQHKRQKELMDIQMRNQQTLNKEAHNMQFEMWNKTNASAQAKHYEDAGLNVGLMYGQGGAGGTTTGSVGSGTAGGGTAVQETPMRGGMEISTALANQELMKAQSEKLKAEAEQIRGAKNDNIIADTAYKKMQTANQEIVNNVGNKTIDEMVMAIKANSDKAQSEARSSLVEANVNEKTQGDRESQIKNEAIASALEAGLKQSKINLDQATIKNMAEQVAIGKFNANQQAEFKGIDAVTGAQINKLINKIYNIFGVKEETETQNKIK